MKVEIRLIDGTTTVYVIEGDATRTLKCDFGATGVFFAGQKILTGFLFKPAITELPNPEPDPPE